MTLYQQLQIDLYNWLKNKYKNDKRFTFSVRQKATKGAELNYFIGTEKSKYFSTTFWYIPVAYPGSSGDLINLVIDLRSKSKIEFFIQFNHTKSPHDKQNEYALEFIRSLKDEIKNNFPNVYIAPDTNKMEFFGAYSKPIYSNFEEMKEDLEKTLETVIPIVDDGIARMKALYPDFIAERFSSEEQERMIGKMEERFNKYKVIEEIEDEPEEQITTFSPTQILNNQPLNQILFGPPGTGKTYNTINKAIQIINPDFNLDQDRFIIKKEYDRLIEEGQIVFTTFHQSMSYEDFVEGIKPVIEEDDEGNKSVIYEVKDGILKLIAKEASIKKFRDKEIQTEYNFDDAWNDLLQNVRAELENNSTLKLNIQTEGMGMNILAISDRGNLVVKPSSSEENRIYTVSYDRTKKLQNAFPDLSKVKNIDKEFRSVIGGSNSTAYWSVVNFINQKIDENSKLSTLKEELPPESFVLIIDEINRGNVSQIFGELITLIEKDKRLGNDEAMEAILPYSKEKFGVPNNLYIIGTMNTADRSVEALDTALRRRFSFEEMPPNYDLDELQQTVFEISLSEILLTLNRRIEKLLDNDHCIGHAYFLGKNEDTLPDAFYRNIIPLLQEYFFGDFGKIRLVLGEGFIRKTENDSDFADFDHSDYADFAEKDSFEIVDYRTPETIHSVRKNEIEITMDFQKAIQILMKQNIA